MGLRSLSSFFASAPKVVLRVIAIGERVPRNVSRTVSRTGRLGMRSRRVNSCVHPRPPQIALPSIAGIRRLRLRYPPDSRGIRRRGDAFHEDKIAASALSLDARLRTPKEQLRVESRRKAMPHHDRLGLGRSADGADSNLLPTWDFATSHFSARTPSKKHRPDDFKSCNFVSVTASIYASMLTGAGAVRWECRSVGFAGLLKRLGSNRRNLSRIGNPA